MAPALIFRVLFRSYAGREANWSWMTGNLAANANKCKKILDLGLSAPVWVCSVGLSRHIQGTPVSKTELKRITTLILAALSRLYSLN
jgi:hypothetical protein